MNIRIGPNINTDFEITDKEGKDITDELRVVSLNYESKQDQLTKVTMVCYVDSLEILEAQVGVTILDPWLPKPTRWERFRRLFK
jgi:hypothetical protein